MRLILILAALSLTTPAGANDWEKFYTPIAKQGDYIESIVPTEEIPWTGNVEADLDLMWRRGFAPIGYTNFNSSNSKTKDAHRLAKKLKARFILLATDHKSSSTASIPITTPNSSTSYSSGTASAYGSGGYASGTYSGTTTTYGTQTSWIPFTVNRYEKFAVFFAEVPKQGIGVQWRELTAEEVARLETRRATAVKHVRDGSPAYNADILPGDIILKVNDETFNSDRWWEFVATGKMTLEIDRAGKGRTIEVTIPEEWR